MRNIWATTELMPFSQTTIDAALAAGASEIVELPYATIPTLQPGFTSIPDVVAVPQYITAFQAKAVLLNAGLLPSVTAYMSSANTPPIIALAWQEAPQYGRNDPAVLAIAGALNLTSEQLDQMFTAAVLINP